MVEEYIAAFDATVNYKEYDKCKINGVTHVYMFDPSVGKKKWVSFDKFKLNLYECKTVEKPSAIIMLKEFVSAYNRQPNELEERLLVEQFKAEFDYWSKNN